jgi:hypothetical protein
MSVIQFTRKKLLAQLFTVIATINSFVYFRHNLVLNDKSNSESLGDNPETC